MFLLTELDSGKNDMACLTGHALQFRTSDLFGTCSNSFNFLPSQRTSKLLVKPLVVEAQRRRANTRTESAKVRMIRFQKKFNGSASKPRLSVYCSEKQLYAALVDDHNKKNLFYASTLQQSIRDSPRCTTVEAAKRVGEELVRACIDLRINEISSYDRNGSSRGERMRAFEVAVSRYGLLMP